MTRLPDPRRGSRSGFTLLELLVALALLGFLATMALGGVRLGARTWDTVTARAEVTGRTQMVRAFLSRELAQALPLTMPAPGGSERLAYDGDAESLTFVAPLAAHFGLGGVQRLRIAVVDAGDARDGEKQLVLIRRPFHPGDDLEADQPDRDEVHVLLDGIAEAEFAYRGLDDGAGWSNSWRGEDELPGLVRLDIAFRDAAAGEWPSLLAARRITADAVCLIPAGSMPCGVR